MIFFFISTFSAQSDTLIALSLKILTEVKEEEDYPVLLKICDQENGGKIERPIVFKPSYFGMSFFIPKT